MIIPQTSVDDIDTLKVEDYVAAVQRRQPDSRPQITTTLLTNLSVIRDGRLTLGGLLFFAKNPQKFRPAFCVKAISFFGNSIGGTDYRSINDVEGEQFRVIIPRDERN